jgi:hypothetical protein
MHGTLLIICSLNKIVVIRSLVKGFDDLDREAITSKKSVVQSMLGEFSASFTHGLSHGRDEKGVRYEGKKSSRVAEKRCSS